LDYRLFLATFAAVFLAELGDKTQLATMTLTAENSQSKWIIFGGASLALCLTTLLGVMFGEAVARIVPPKVIKIGAAVLFIGIGVFMLVSKEKPVESRYGALIHELQVIRAKSEAGCVQCEKFQAALRRLESANDRPLAQAVSFLTIDIARAKPARSCESCTAERVDRMFDDAQKEVECKSQSAPMG